MTAGAPLRQDDRHAAARDWPALDFFELLNEPLHRGPRGAGHHERRIGQRSFPVSHERSHIDIHIAGRAGRGDDGELARMLAEGLDVVPIGHHVSAAQVSHFLDEAGHDLAWFERDAWLWAAFDEAR